MTTVIETCAALSDADCGAYVKTQCAADAASCGVYYQFFTVESIEAFIYMAVAGLLLAFAFRVFKKTIMPGW